jgi:hypothetical protein
MSRNKADFAFFCWMAASTLTYALIALWIYAETDMIALVVVWAPIGWVFATYIVAMAVCAFMGALSVAEKLITFCSGWYPADADLARDLHKWLYRERNTPGPNQAEIYAALRNVRNKRLGRPL